MKVDDDDDDDDDDDEKRHVLGNFILRKHCCENPKCRFEGGFSEKIVLEV